MAVVISFLRGKIRYKLYEERVGLMVGLLWRQDVNGAIKLIDAEGPFRLDVNQSCLV